MVFQDQDKINPQDDQSKTTNKTKKKPRKMKERFIINNMNSKIVISLQLTSILLNLQLFRATKKAIEQSMITKSYF